MSPLSDSIPKGLVPLAGKTIITRLIEVLAESGVESIRVGLGWRSGMFKEHLLELEGLYDLNIVDVNSIERGPLHTLVTTMDQTDDEPYLISPVDYVTEPDIVKQVITAHTHANDSRLATISVDPTSKERTSVFVCSDGRVSGLKEPVINHDTTYPTAMLAAVNPRAKRFFREAHASGRKTVAEAINQMILNGVEVFSTQIAGRWFDIDTISSLLAASKMILERDPLPSSGCIIVPSGDMMDFETNVDLGSGIQFASGVSLQGPAYISSRCRIAEGCKIGPNVSMSSGTTVSRDSIISDCILIGSNSIKEGQHITDAVIYGDTIFKEAT